MELRAVLTITGDPEKPNDLEIECEFAQEVDPKRAFERAVGHMLDGIVSRAKRVEVEAGG